MPQVPQQRWSCHSCGDCCRSLVGHLFDDECTRLDEQGWASELGIAPYVRVGRNRVLNKSEDGACVFLDENNRCRIHAKYGEAAKPIACRIFPFSLRRIGDVWQASLRFDCPSVTSSKGVPIEQHRGDVAKLANMLQERGMFRGSMYAVLRDAAARTDAMRAWPGADKGREHMAGFHERARFRGRLRATPQELDTLTDALVRWFRQGELPFEQRVVGAARLTVLLNKANLKRVRGERFAELVGLLTSALSSEARLPANPPTEKQRGMLRQLVFAHAEHVSLHQLRAGFMSRLLHRGRQTAAAQRFLRGTGAVPILPGVTGSPTFEDVEGMKPMADATDEADNLLVRYLLARLTGRSVFGAGYYGWPVFAGLTALWLSVAAAGWLARYRAALDGRRTIVTDDIASSIGIVDRSATRSPSLGTLAERTRVAYLLRDDGISRLLTRYALTQPGQPTTTTQML